MLPSSVLIILRHSQTSSFVDNTRKILAPMFLILSVLSSIFFINHPCSKKFLNFNVNFIFSLPIFLIVDLLTHYIFCAYTIRATRKEALSSQFHLQCNPPFCANHHLSFSSYDIIRRCPPIKQNGRFIIFFWLFLFLRQYKEVSTPLVVSFIIEYFYHFFS